MTPAPSLIQNVLHPSDFTEASHVAFVHALKAALVARSQLALLHVTQEENVDWTDFPGVRDTLLRWGLIPEGSGKSAVARLGVDVIKVIRRESDPVKAVLGYLERHGTDLIVLASHRHGDAWWGGGVAEPIARQSNEMTLFLPAGVPGFVSAEDGSVSLRHVLLPITTTPRPHAAISAAARLVQQLGCASGVFTLLHSGDSSTLPAVHPPEVEGWEWRTVVTEGNPVDDILTTARTGTTDLIVMTTDGRNGFLDALRGSHSERVLLDAPCPLLAIPEMSSIAVALA